eukprot:scaffold20073_cov95-Skeletonema_marinoi.AAC.1
MSCDWPQPRPCQVHPATAVKVILILLYFYDARLTKLLWPKQRGPLVKCCGLRHAADADTDTAASARKAEPS